MRIAIIGGGAAGCFCAIGLKRRLPDAEVTVYEAGPKLLAKVAVTGGGRCNLTNSFRDVHRLGEVYPRGEQLMRRALAAFSHEDTMRWFEAEGVRLTVQEDQCVFPVSQDAMQIVRTLERCLRDAGVCVRHNTPVERVEDLDADRIVVTTGGSSREKLERLLPAGVEVTPCVPSLFTLKIPDEGLRALMGTVVEQASLALAGTRFRAAGTLLLTDWGVSGPATLRLSSYAARHLAENGYTGTLLIGWLDAPEAAAREWIAATAAANPRKQAAGTPPAGLTARLWRHLLSRAGLREDLRWAELGSKGAARLAATLTADAYPVAGRARFKEEFVTCGGVALSGVNLNTLESKTRPGLFFAGEVLDLDAVTGGFNLQAAWSTAALVAAAMK
ncbi:MAG: aminoacetone oxidase family FAD-binding enzyme [Bacteroidales bacterium]|nr:aminoacetone oxidase family FAD-binding enzyme [Bacteroidales bacterium]MBR6876096.1 aminoacetone oxidase family FAD-binding enzyme [Bacteroidales bacterium]